MEPPSREPRPILNRASALRWAEELEAAGPTRRTANGCLLAGDPAEKRARAAEPIVLPSQSECIDNIRAFVRTLHHFYLKLPAMVETATTRYQPQSIGLKLLNGFSGKSWSFLTRLNPEALRALGAYYHHSAEWLRFGDRAFPDEELKAKLDASRVKLKEFDIPLEPELERMLANPCRQIELANFSLRVESRATRSSVHIAMTSDSGSIEWHDGDRWQRQPLPPSDVRYLLNNRPADPADIVELEFPRGTESLRIDQTGIEAFVVRATERNYNS